MQRRGRTERDLARASLDLDAAAGLVSQSPKEHGFGTERVELARLNQHGCRIRRRCVSADQQPRRADIDEGATSAHRRRSVQLPGEIETRGGDQLELATIAR